MFYVFAVLTYLICGHEEIISVDVRIKDFLRPCLFPRKPLGDPLSFSSSVRMVSMDNSVSGMRSLAFLVLGLGFLARVIAFDNTRKDNVSTSYAGRVCLKLIAPF